MNLTNNPTFTWKIGDNTSSVTLRRSGAPNSGALSLVVENSGGESTFNGLIDANGQPLWTTATLGNTLTTRCNLPRLIAIQQYDADFGSIATNASSGLKTFTVTISSGRLSDITDYRNQGYTISPGILSGSGAYGNPFSYSVTSNNLNTGGSNIVISSNAMNLSNGTHSLTVRFIIGIFAYQ